MKRMFFAIVAMMLSVTSIYMYAEDYDEDSDDIILVESDRSKNRPNSTTDEVIACQKVGNLLTIYLPETVEHSSVLIYNYNHGWMGYVTQNENVIQLPFSTGEFTIELQTSDGRIFTGRLIF